MCGEIVETNEYRRLIHNDLGNAAYWHFQTARRKSESGEGGGLALDIMAALILYAFYTEAILNFVGHHHLEEGWPDKASFGEKLALLKRVLDLKLSNGEEPLQTLTKLKRFRNTLAHGKPDIGVETKIVNEVSDDFAALRAAWEADLDFEFLAACRNATQQLRDILFEAAKIEPWDAVTRAYGSAEHRAEKS